MTRLQVEEERLRNALETFQQVYHQVPPEIVKALRDGETFRKRGLTPFYIMDMSNASVFVTSEEMMDKKLH